MLENFVPSADAIGRHALGFGIYGLSPRVYRADATGRHALGFGVLAGTDNLKNSDTVYNQVSGAQQCIIRF